MQPVFDDAAQANSAQFDESSVIRAKLSCRRRDRKGRFGARTAAATASADDLEQFFRLRVLMFGAAIELQIVETAIVAGFGQQLGVGADFFYVAAIHHHDLIGG